jgi:CubicO group peptidase (beta-lactamase class C family)
MPFSTLHRAGAASLCAILQFTSLGKVHAAQGDPVVGRVDSLVTAEMRRQRIPGLSLAVVREGRVVLSRGFGLANIEHEVPVTPQTIFQSGSVGKQFTATLVMMLVEEGRVKLEDPITKYFPSAPAGWSAITIRHLLTHTAGTTDYPDDFDFRRDYTEDELLDRAFTIPLAFQPGEKWSYSNLGYVLLGIMIHRITGQFYGDLLQERIFKPLGMHSARIITEADIVPHRAAGYRLVNGQIKNQEWVSPSVNTTADGSLYLSAEDMTRWDAALDTEQLLKRSSLAQMWTPVTLKGGGHHPYGFGWSLGEVKGHPIIEHGGSWQGFKSYIARYPDQRLAVIIFANLSSAEPGRIAHGVAAIYDPKLQPEPVASIPDREPAVTTFARELLQGLTAGSVDSNLFEPEERARIMPLVEPGAAVLKELGQVRSFDLLERTEEGDNRSYRYRVVYEGRNLLLDLRLTSQKRVARLRLQAEP